MSLRTGSALLLFLLLGWPSRADCQVSLPYTRIPLVFEENKGQIDSRVRFATHTRDFALHLTPSEAVFSLQKVGLPRESVRLGWGSSITPEGITPQPGRANYFSGTDSSRWRRGIRQFGQVRYPEIFPGIDLIFYGNHRKLEYDLVVAPGADPRSLRLHLDGARRLAVTPQGDLRVHLKTTYLDFTRPVGYQQIGGTRHPVKVSYRLQSRKDIQLDVAPYDPSYPLVIDPSVSMTYLGGGDTDLVSAVAVDSAGNTYVTGYTTSIDFPHPTGSAFKSTLNDGDADAFVIKLNPQATAILYATYLGGTQADFGRAIAVDSSGNAYITGSTIGEFPITSGAYRTTITASPSVFIAKLDPTGGTLVYSTLLDAAGAGAGIAVDTSGNAYVTGYTYTAGFTTSSGAFQRRLGGGTDAFVVKVNPAGIGLAYATFLGGNGEDQGTAIDIDSSGNAYVAGFTSSPNFPTTTGAFKTTYGGSIDAFVTKLNPTGTALVWSTFLGGTSTDRAYAVAVDSSSNVFVAGQTYSSGFPVTAGAYNTTFAGGGSDAFVAKILSTGASLLYSTFLGSSSSCTIRDPFRVYQCDAAYGIAIDPVSRAWVTGLAGPGFPTTPDAVQPIAASSADAFVTELNAAGSALVYSTFLGGSQAEAATGIKLDATGVNVTLTGFTQSSDLPATSGSLQPTSPGGATDGFLARIAGCAVTLAATTSFFPPSAGSFNLGVFAPSGCSWQAFSNQPWLTLGTATGTGNGSIQCFVAANFGPSRIAQLYVSGPTFTLTQNAGGPATCPASPVTGDGSWFGADGGTFNLAVSAACPWTASTAQSWITLNSGAAGTGNGTINYTIAPNSSQRARLDGLITITGTTTSTYAIRQVGSTCTYSLSRQSQYFNVGGGSSSLTVTTQSNCTWNVSNPASWVSIDSGASGTGSGTVSYTVAPNASGTVRFVNITIGGQTFTISQDIV